jgi:hypothetical protein
MATSEQTKRVKLGPCLVTFNAIDLGLTKGGVEVSITTNKHEVTVDQFGSTAINDIITGRTGMVTVPMAETDLAKLLLVIPGAVLVTDSTTPTKKKLEIPTAVGTSLIESAKVLTLHPKANAASNKADDVTIPLASPAGDITFSFQVENERVYAIEFRMYPDEVTGLLAVLGDITAVAA